MNTSTRWTAAALVAIAGVSITGCETTPKTAEKQAALHTESDAALASFKASDPTLNDLMSRSVAWVLFPEVGKGGFIIGASHGKGTVYTHGGRVGFASLSQGTIGLQAGGQTFRELVVFMSQAEFDKFKKGDFSLEANASAVALKSGAARSADLGKGVVVFVETTGGLMAEAAIGGQVLKYEANQPITTGSTTPSSGTSGGTTKGTSGSSKSSW